MNNIFVSWKQKIESRIISDLKSQYTESEEQIRQRKEQFLKKQKKIILIEIIAGAVFLAFLIIRAAFLQDDIKRIGYNLFCYHRMEWGLLRLS